MKRIILDFKQFLDILITEGDHDELRKQILRSLQNDLNAPTLMWRLITAPARSRRHNECNTVSQTSQKL